MTSLREKGVAGRWLHRHLLPLHQAAERRLHDLNYLFFEITQRCNLKCRHCGSDCQCDATVPDLPAARVIEVLQGVREKHDPGRITIALTGGEPLLHKELFSMGSAMMRLGFPWGMVTNGWAWTEEKVDKARRAGMKTITVSLDGTGEDHDWFRGRAGSFDRACAALKMLTAQDWIQKVDVVSCVHRRNLDHLDEMRALIGELGVRRWRLFTVSPIGRAAEDPQLMLDAEGFQKLMRWITLRRGTPGPRLTYSESGFLGRCETEVRDQPFFCRAGINVAGIMADGGILACPNIDRRYAQGNIHTEDFCDVWENKYQVFRDRRWMKNGACENCAEWNRCQGNSFHLRDGATGRTRFCYLNEYGLGEKTLSARG